MTSEGRHVALRTDFELGRSTPFSYECRGCARCCYGKSIPVNPYEILRIARLLGTSTTEVLARSTGHGGALLRARDDGGCVFLEGRSCTIHAARPLACRLSPLGRKLADGVEAFAEVVPHPASEGVYGEEGTIGDYVSAQAVEPYVAAAEAYVKLLKTMLQALSARGDVESVSADATSAMQRAPAPGDESWLDVDAVVGRWCSEHDQEIPEDVDAKIALHMRVVAQWCESAPAP